MKTICRLRIPTAKELFNLNGWEHAGLFADIRYIWEALSRLTEYIEALPHKNTIPLKNAGPDSFFYDADRIVIIDAHIEGSSTFNAGYGPIFIGRRVRIGPDVYIRGPALISDNCVIGHGSEIKNSILLPGARAAHRNYVGDSILGNNVNLGNGTSLNNERFNKAEIKFFAEETDDAGEVCDVTIHTGLTKLGAILGDDVKTGSGVAINPGTIVHRGSWLFSTREYGPGIWTQGRVRLERRHI